MNDIIQKHLLSTPTTTTTTSSSLSSMNAVNDGDEEDVMWKYYNYAMSNEKGINYSICFIQ